jgi:hypothetical protein
MYISSVDIIILVVEILYQLHVTACTYKLIKLLQLSITKDVHVCATVLEKYTVINQNFSDKVFVVHENYESALSKYYSIND